MRKLVIGLGVIVILLGGWWGYSSMADRQGPAAPSPAEAPVIEPEDVIWASGKLVPVQWAGLSPAVGGTIRTIHVQEGEQVQAGTVLVDLENDVLQSQVDVAAAALAEAEAARSKLLAGATPGELATSQTNLALAEADLAQAQAALQKVQAAVAAAEAQVAIAQAEYNRLASGLTEAEKEAARRDVAMAEAALRQAQANYDRVRDAPDIGARPEALALEQATIAYETAQARYTVVTQGATPQQLAVAQAQIRAAQAQAAIAGSDIPVAEAAVQAARARVTGAQRALEVLQAGATAEERAMAEARVQSARAALAAAQAQLKETQIIASFAGQVGSILAREGELASPGRAVVVLGDTGQMHVETTDLRETDVTRVGVDMPVEVTFDALPNRIFHGAITRIAPMSTVEHGSTNYTVIVEVSGLDPVLRWGMTAFANIQAR